MSHKYLYRGVSALESYVKKRLQDSGWERAEGVFEADAVITYFTGETALEDAYLEADGLVRECPKGTVLVDLSACTPSFARELGAIATVNDLAFAESPLVVQDPSSPNALHPENVAAYLACDDDEAEAVAREVLACLAASVFKVGDYGQAQVAKASATVRIASELLGAVEAHALVQAAGCSLDDRLPCGVVAESANAALAEKRFDGSYTVEMMMADVVAAMRTAEEKDLILPQLEAVMHLIEVCAVIGGTDMAPAALSLLYADEKSCAEAGLDWSRADGLFQDGGHVHAPGDDEDDYFGLGAFDDFDADDAGFGIAGGYGGYSSN